MNTNEIEVGKSYYLDHSRFGSATVKLLARDGEWLDVEILHGKLAGITQDWHFGETKRVRECHCRGWLPVSTTKAHP